MNIWVQMATHRIISMTAELTAFKGIIHDEAFGGVQKLKSFHGMK